MKEVLLQSHIEKCTHVDILRNIFNFTCFPLLRYIGNLPPGITVPQLIEFVNAAMKQLGIAKDPSMNSVVSAWISTDGHYAFCELRTLDEANNALVYMNGLAVGAFSLKVGRPKGYTAAPGAVNPLLAATGVMPGATINPLLGMGGLAGSMSSEPMSNVLMVTNLPSGISDQQIKELFSPFGEVSCLYIKLILAY